MKSLTEITSLIGKCPKCKHVYCLIYLNKQNERGDRIYRCVNCGAVVGSPTDYGYCELKGKIWRDVFYNPCVKCKDKIIIQLHEHNVCKYWKGLAYEEIA